MVYTILQFFDLLFDGRYTLKIIQCDTSRHLFWAVVQTSQCSTKVWNNIKACFLVAKLYFAVVGMISLGFSDDFWDLDESEELAGYESILSPSSP